MAGSGKGRTGTGRVRTTLRVKPCMEMKSAESRKVFRKRKRGIVIYIVSKKAVEHGGKHKEKNNEKKLQRQGVLSDEGRREC